VTIGDRRGGGVGKPSCLGLAKDAVIASVTIKSAAARMRIDAQPTRER
jgi:hypothetical protein